MRQPRRTEVVDRLLPAVPEINTLGSGKWPRSRDHWQPSDSVDKWSILIYISEFEDFLFSSQVKIGQDFKYQYHVIMSLKNWLRAVCYYVLSIFFRCISWTLWLLQLVFCFGWKVVSTWQWIAVTMGYGARVTADISIVRTASIWKLSAFRHPRFEIALPS